MFGVISVIMNDHCHIYPLVGGAYQTPSPNTPPRNKVDWVVEQPEEI